MFIQVAVKDKLSHFLTERNFHPQEVNHFNTTVENLDLGFVEFNPLHIRQRYFSKTTKRVRDFLKLLKCFTCIRSLRKAKHFSFVNLKCEVGRQIHLANVLK